MEGRFTANLIGLMSCQDTMQRRQLMIPRVPSVAAAVDSIQETTLDNQVAYIAGLQAKPGGCIPRLTFKLLFLGQRHLVEIDTVRPRMRDSNLAPRFGHCGVSLVRANSYTSLASPTATAVRSTAIHPQRDAKLIDKVA